jgi:glycosyltransferase involved in cell wall biosynthesis
MIVVCEPLCRGWEHVPINAALLEIVCGAFPSSEIAFYGEESHITSLQTELDGATARAISWRPVPRPRRHAAFGERWYADARLMWHLVHLLRNATEGHLLLCGATPVMVLMIKMLVWSGAGRGNAVQIVCHGELASLTGWRSRNPFMRMRDWRSALTASNDRQIQFIVLEAPIRKSVVALFPALTSHLAVLDHPIPSIDLPASDVEFRAPFRFGFLGLASDAKGFPAFLEMAAVLRERFCDRVEFHAIGTLPPNSLVPSMEALTVKPAMTKSSRSDFTRDIQQLHYVCLPYQGEHYELSPSGVLMDAIAFGKPVLSTGIPVVRALFERFGDIGYLCTDTLDFCDAITQIVNEADELRYRSQVRALRAVRESRTPAALAPTYRNMTPRRGSPLRSAVEQEV